MCAVRTSLESVAGVWQMVGKGMYGEAELWGVQKDLRVFVSLACLLHLAALVTDLRRVRPFSHADITLTSRTTRLVVTLYPAFPTLSFANPISVAAAFVFGC